MTQAVDAGLDITMHRLLLGMRVNELDTMGIEMIAIVAALPRRQLQH